MVRQEELLGKSQEVSQETRGYDQTTGRTYSQRTKEEAQDYRYFPEPDIAPLRFSGEEIEKIKESLPELPGQKSSRLGKTFQLPAAYLNILIEDSSRAEYFEESAKLGEKEGISAKVIADLMINKNMDKDFPEPAGLIKKITELTRTDYSDISQVKEAINKVVSQNSKAVADYRAGKEQVIGFLIGQVQAELKGKGDAKQISKELLAALTKDK